MKKTPFVTKQQVEEIVKTYPRRFTFMMKKGFVRMQKHLKKRFHGIRDFVSILQ